MKYHYLSIVLVLLAIPCSAITRMANDNIVVPAGQTIDDSVFAAGESVRIEGTINGDLLAFAGRVIVRGDVKGNIYTGARDVEIAGNVEGGVMSISQRFELGGTIARNLYAFGQTVRTDPTAKIGGDANTFGATVDLDGTVDRSVQIFAQDAALGAAVTRNANFRGERLNVLDSARITGEVIAQVPNSENVRVSSGAQIGGQVTRQVTTREGGRGIGAAIIYYVLWFIAAYICGLVFVMAVPQFVANAATDVSHGWRTFLLGLAVLLVVPAMLLLIGITVVGIPLALIGFALYLIVAYLAKIIVAVAIGRRLAAGHSRALVLFFGLLVVTALYLIPFGIGWLARLIVTCLGFGALAWGTRMPALSRRAMAPMQHPLPFGA